MSEPAQDTPESIEHHIDAVSWDDAGFVRRTRAAAANRGMTLPEVCRAAGIAKDYLAKTPSGGRNLLSVLKIAAVLGVDPGYLTGFAQVVEVEKKPAPPSLEESRLQALALATSIAAHVYLVLSSSQRLPLPSALDKDQLFELMTQLIDPATKKR